VWYYGYALYPDVLCPSFKDRVAVTVAAILLIILVPAATRGLQLIFVARVKMDASSVVVFGVLHPHQHLLPLLHHH